MGIYWYIRGYCSIKVTTDKWSLSIGKVFDIRTSCEYVHRVQIPTNRHQHTVRNGLTSINYIISHKLVLSVD